jgi:hypothetical protein
MRGSFRIEGYAIVSADGMIADAGGLMPNSLKIEADQRFYSKALDRAAVVAHGRLSHEGQPKSASRRRLSLRGESAVWRPTPTTRTPNFGTLPAPRLKRHARLSAAGRARWLS